MASYATKKATVAFEIACIQRDEAIAERDALAARVAELEGALLEMKQHAALFNRDTDEIWLAVKQRAEAVIAKGGKS